MSDLFMNNDTLYIVMTTVNAKLHTLRSEYN